MGLTYEGKRRFLANPDDRRHGTSTGYNYGCRCDACSEIGRAKARERRERHYEKQLERARAARAREKGLAKAKRQRAKKQECCTVDELLLPMMGKPNIDNESGVCCICGRPASDKHHIVKRSAGKWVVDGREIRKPTVRLCGSGNASGCHGKAHKGLLHFRWVDNEKCNNAPLRWCGGGHWSYLLTEKPVKYQEALETEGWRRLCAEYQNPTR